MTGIVDDLLARAPRFHSDWHGKAVSWGISEEILRFIEAHVDASSRTLETGAGLSTVVFARAGAEHVSIVPAPDEVQRIREYCAENGVSTDRLLFYEDRSELVLPSLEPTELDFVLIDGSHSFPVPFIDWYYTAFRLRVGGYLVIDDVELWTGKVLKEFLASEPEWSLVQDTAYSVVFVKTSPVNDVRSWEHQDLVVRRTRRMSPRVKVRRAMHILRTSGGRNVLRRVLKRDTRRRDLIRE